MRRRPLRLTADPLEQRVMLTTFFVESGGSIQDAINSAAASPGPDTVMIKSGDYHENVTINDADQLAIRGMGDVTIHDTSDADDDVIKIERADGGLSIQNINIVGGDRGIDANDESSLASLSLLKVTTNGTDSDGLRIEEAGTSSVKIRHCGFYDGSDGMDLSEIESIHAIHSTAEGNDGQGLEVDNSGRIHVVGGHFVDNVEGLEVDDAQVVRIVDGLFADNDDEGLDIDNVGNIAVVGVTSSGNGGSGLQIAADDNAIPVSSAHVVNSRFDDNGEDGVQVVVDDPGQIAQLSLIGNTSTSNTDQGFDIDPDVGSVNAQANTANGNGDDTLPS